MSNVGPKYRHKLNASLLSRQYLTKIASLQHASCLLAPQIFSLWLSSGLASMPSLRLGGQRLFLGKKRGKCSNLYFCFKLIHVFSATKSSGFTWCHKHSWAILFSPRGASQAYSIMSRREMYMSMESTMHKCQSKCGIYSYVNSIYACKHEKRFASNCPHSKYEDTEYLPLILNFISKHPNLHFKHDLAQNVMKVHFFYPGF